MKFLFAIVFVLTIWANASTQTLSYPFYQLYQLDSIGKTNSISRHFGALYSGFLQLVEKQLENADSTTERLVRNFEMVFAQFYIDACNAYKNNQQIALPAWRNYFTDNTLHPVQYYLLGANAHLNGGLAEAIAGSYTAEEWKQLKSKYVIFNKCLNKTYLLVYRKTITESRKAKLLDWLSLGFDKCLGQYYLYKWRKRQMRLAEYYFSGSAKYKPLLDKINRKKERIDRMVVTQLKK